MSIELTIRRPDDWHLHLRDNDMLKGVLPFSSLHYSRGIIMPNLVPPLKTTQEIAAYRDRILAACPDEHDFTPLMTAYLSDDTNPTDLVEGFKQGIIKAAKLYPANATTNSAQGVSSIDNISHVLDAMQQADIPLLIHGEVTDSTIDIFDREAKFIEKILIPLVARYPALRIVLEHATTSEAVEFVMQNQQNVAATITPQHVLYNRNALFNKGLNPHNYCLPILKREKHRQALIKAITSGCERFFLGTDSAPHEQMRKESSCGCAGAFNALVALSVYVQVFETANALDKFEAFASLNGPKFYKLPVNKESLTLVKRDFLVPDTLAIAGVGNLIPFLAGQTLAWSIKN
ncbi:dihydroorotase [Providencia sp. Me31A]|uniref:dihydroorotase n=1 Tax=Providencia sp. Me31A TaxID=3392637 RepID=UPI003D2AF0F5